MSLRYVHIGIVTGLLFGSVAWGKAEVQDDPTRLMVRNDQVTVILSKADKGAIVSLTDNATGQEFIAKQAEPCLFRLVFTKSG